VNAHLTEHGSGVTVNWVWVANELKVTSGEILTEVGLLITGQTNRTPLDCMRHGAVRKTHIWTPESDNALLEAVEVYGLNNWLLGTSQVTR